MNSSIRATIVNIEAEAQYQSSIYEWTITVEIDSQTLTLFQGKSHVTEDDLGSEVDLKVRALLLQEITLVDDYQPSLQQLPDRESKWSATIIGRVLSTETDQEATDAGDTGLVVDVGSGTVLVQLDNSPVDVEAFASGDLVCAHCGRVDIIGKTE